MRSWTVTLSGLDGLEWLTANQRLHHHPRARRTRAIRVAARDAARAAGIPHLGVVMVVGYVHPASRRRFDPANWYPSFKAGVDGLVDAGVVEDDDHTRLSGPHMFPAGRRRGGALTLVVAPARRCGCGHDLMEHLGDTRCVRPGCSCLAPGWPR